MKTPSLLRFFLIFHIIICGTNFSFAQKYSPKYLRENDKTLLALTSNATANGWLEFRRDKDAEVIDPDTFFDRFGKNVGLGEGYQMKLIQDETDFRQIRHQRFQLYYKNIRVEGVEFSLHSRDKRLETAHGRIVENLNVDVSKPIAERQALDAALADQKLTINDFKGNDLPKGELLLAMLGEEAISQNFVLCHTFNIRTEGLVARKEGYSEPQRVYIDALSGKIVRRVSLIQRCFHVPEQTFTTKTDAIRSEVHRHHNLLTVGNAPLTISSFVPRWSNYLNGQTSLSFETEQSGSQFRLSYQNGALLTRRDVNNTGNWINNPDVLNSSTNWGTNSQNATTAHWLTQRVYQFYQQFAPDQNGINRQGTYPHILVDYNPAGENPLNLVNAFWNNSDMLAFGFAPIGPSNPNPDYSRTLVTADILGMNILML